MLSRFHLVPERNGQTDERTDRQICYINIVRQYRAIKFGIILRCNPWAVGSSPEGTFYGFCMGKIGQNPKIGQL